MGKLLRKRSVQTSWEEAATTTTRVVHIDKNAEARKHSKRCRNTSSESNQMAYHEQSVGRLGERGRTRTSVMLLLVLGLSTCVPLLWLQIQWQESSFLALASIYIRVILHLLSMCFCSCICSSLWSRRQHSSTEPRDRHWWLKGLILYRLCSTYNYGLCSISGL